MSDLDLTVTRVYDATPQEIWDVFTDPQHLHKFFGPEGTTIPIEELTMDVRVGGEFSLTMHNEHSGDTYPMKAEYVILEEPTKIQFKTTGGIVGTITIEDLQLAGKTLLTWHTSAEIDNTDGASRAGAIIGTHSAMDNLGNLLTELAAA